MEKSIGVKLMIDSVSKRIVYVARNGILPERVMIVDAGRQYLFAPSACESIDYAGELPAGVSPQKCWGFRLGEQGVEEVH